MLLIPNSAAFFRFAFHLLRFTSALSIQPDLGRYRSGRSAASLADLVTSSAMIPGSKSRPSAFRTGMGGQLSLAGRSSLPAVTCEDRVRVASPRVDLASSLCSS